VGKSPAKRLPTTSRTLATDSRAVTSGFSNPREPAEIVLRRHRPEIRPSRRILSWRSWMTASPDLRVRKEIGATRVGAVRSRIPRKGIRSQTPTVQQRSPIPSSELCGCRVDPADRGAERRHVPSSLPVEHSQRGPMSSPDETFAHGKRLRPPKSTSTDQSLPSHRHGRQRSGQSPLQPGSRRPPPASATC
jgi:hypothetical protein